MRIGKIILLNIFCMLLLTFGVSAAGQYIVDDAKVLKQDTISTVESNLSKIYENTEVTVKIDVVKSLNGKSIDDYAKQYAKDNIKGDKYILFVTSVNDKKDIILTGSGVNNILSNSDVKSLQELPLGDYKANNYDAGIMKVGKAIDEKVTAKAVKAGKAEVKNNGYSTTVQHKTNYFGIFIFILIIVIIGVIIFKFIKRKADNDYENRKRKFAQDNNIDYGNDAFRSGNVSGGSRTTYSNSNSNNYGQNGNSRMYDNSNYGPSGGPSVNNTTIINDRNNGSGFVEGMIVGEMLSESHHHHHHDDYYDDYRERSGGHNHGSSSYDNDSSHVTSGDWDTNTGSSWGDSSSDSSSSSWDSGSSSDSSSSWDSGSSGDSGSSDSGSSGW